jgi:hypothetical protein
MQNFISYISGWLSALGWQSNIAVTAYVTSSLILAAAGLTRPDFTPTAWSVPEPFSKHSA